MYTIDFTYHKHILKVVLNGEISIDEAEKLAIELNEKNENCQCLLTDACNASFSWSDLDIKSLKENFYKKI